MLKDRRFMTREVQIHPLPARGIGLSRFNSRVNTTIFALMRNLVLYKLLLRSSKLNGK